MQSRSKEIWAAVDSNDLETLLRLLSEEQQDIPDSYDYDSDGNPVRLGSQPYDD